jgi:NADPH2:quinone reductase
MWRNPGLMQQSLAELLSWYAQGLLKPHVSQTFPLAQARDALVELLERRTTGKVVITMR